jgi:hypothetical protein
MDCVNQIIRAPALPARNSWRDSASKHILSGSLAAINMAAMKTTQHAARLLALVCPLLVAASAPAAEPADPLDECNVVWNSPSKDSTGSMPLGNGDIGANVWAEEGGDLVFYISKTDAWDGLGRLLKLGRVRVTFTPNPFAAGRPFRQTLRLRQGEIEIVAGPPAEAVTVRIRVDAHLPVVRIEAAGAKPFDIQANLEVWRTREGPLEGKNRDSARGVLNAPEPMPATPDVIQDAEGDRLVWYHRNTTSCWPVTMKVQGLEGLVNPEDDPLLGRTFGGAIMGEGLAKESPTALKSRQAARQHAISIYAMTHADWRGELERLIARASAVSPEKARAGHLAWWDAFWNRSWIRVSGTSFGAEMSTNALPLRIGAASNGGSRFAGDIARPMIFSRALAPEEIAALAARKDAALAKDPALVASWTLENLKDGAFANVAPGGNLPAKASGPVEVVDAPGGKAARLTGKGWLEVADSPKLGLTKACTLAAWVAPAKGCAGDGRIIDKSVAGSNNGYLLDVHPGGNSLRFITAAATLMHKADLAAGQWTHVAATFDAAGEARLYVNGKAAAAQAVGAATPVVTQGYTLQRFSNACGGRGAMPIKFNGSIFTVDIPGADGDYRRWGGCFWFQNTRLPYWSMPACGDYDLMRPLFKMYTDALPFRKAVTKLYYNHDGAFYDETIYFWGTPCNDDYRWKRDGAPVHLLNNPYIMRYWQGGLELAMMMLDCFDHTGDKAFAKSQMVPFAEAIVTFYDKHYPRETDGRIRFEPAQSLERWWKAVNPMPEIAGLRAVLPRLLALPEDLTTAAQRGQWKRLLAQVPPIPLREADGKKVLAAAQEFSARHNIENPELYAIFPYRLYGVGRPDLAVARDAFEIRIVKGSQGWQQDPVQSAMLGLAEEAAQFVAKRFSTHDRGSRFPAFWGPNFDWTPDQCHGANGMMGLQAMLLQSDGRKLLLFPAWPKAWDVEFRLRAPLGTTVEGVYRSGKLQRLTVTPPERAKDLIAMEPQ